MISDYQPGLFYKSLGCPEMCYPSQVLEINHLSQPCFGDQRAQRQKIISQVIWKRHSYTLVCLENV